jgi:ABC-type Fe3+/spermidine/putrescine transport system ATPase subunit
MDLRGEISVEGVITQAVYLGAFTRYHVLVDDTQLIVMSQNLERRHTDVGGTIGRRVRLGWNEDSCRPLAGTTETTPVVAIP